jgi:hypothetical protein
VRRLVVATVAGVLCAGVAGCSSATPGDISPAAARVLRAQVEHVREVAAGGSYSQLKAAVAALKAQVEQFRRDGDVSSSRAVAIDDAADELLQDTSPSPKPIPSPTTTSPTPSPTPTTTTPPPTTTSPPVVVTTTVATSSSPPGNGNGNGNGNGGTVSLGPVGH